ncbi:MAG: DUF2971 domain-containing protein [Flavonifractor plautii]|nr:DUF2971 domain-containing protein [Flavonifractor plautii]
MDIKKLTDYFQIPPDYRFVVQKCLMNRLLHGKEDGSYFDPSGTITLAEVCKIMTYSLNYMKEPVLGLTEPRDSFSLERGHWAEAYLQYCRSLGIYPYDARDTYPDKPLAVHDANLIANCLYDFLLRSYTIERHIDLSTSPLNDSPDKNVTRSEICLIFINIYCSFWYSVLYTCILGNDKSDTINAYIGKLLEDNETFPFLSEDTRYFINCLITQEASENIPLEHLSAIFQLQHLKESAFCVDLPYSVFHFTNIKALSSLSKVDSKLRLTNSAFLNDPSEGLVARKYLKSYTESHSDARCSSLINKFLNSNPDTIPISSTYVASFNRTLDNTSLPMWYQYGDKGAGCAIEFNTEKFSAPIYKLFYLPEDLNLFNHFMDSVFNVLSVALEGSSVGDHSFFENFVSSFLEQISFLFKDNCYAHEKEIRAIISCEPQNALTESEPRAGEFFPRTYCETNYQIKSVTFGPKAQNVAQLIVGCASQGLNCKFKRSSLPFQ